MGDLGCVGFFLVILIVILIVVLYGFIMFCSFLFFCLIVVLRSSGEFFIEFSRTF